MTMIKLFNCSIVNVIFFLGGELFQKISCKDYLLSENIVRILIKQAPFAFCVH